jgi:hypothetical protein
MVAGIVISCRGTARSARATHSQSLLRRSMLAVLLQSSLGLELHDGRRITGVIVGIDYPRGSSGSAL